LNVFELQSRVHLPRPREEVFAFFAEADNLDLLTPGWLHFQIVSPPPLAMAEGTRIDYRLRLRGIPLSWRSEITAWEPPRRFVDEQRRGPYRIWIHEHTFEEQGGGTLCADRVRYAVPGGALANRLFVAPDLRRIFAHRTRQLRERFGGEAGGDEEGEITIRSF